MIGLQQRPAHKGDKGSQAAAYEYSGKIHSLENESTDGLKKKLWFASAYKKQVDAHR
jgi:hypothetical protein